MEYADVLPTQLAELVPAHPVTVSAWRRGKTPPEPMLRWIAVLLGVRLKWLKTGEGAMLGESWGPSTLRLVREPREGYSAPASEESLPGYAAGYRRGYQDGLRDRRQPFTLEGKQPE